MERGCQQIRVQWVRHADLDRDIGRRRRVPERREVRWERGQRLAPYLAVGETSVILRTLPLHAN